MVAQTKQQEKIREEIDAEMEVVEKQYEQACAISESEEETTPEEHVVSDHNEIEKAQASSKQMVLIQEHLQEEEETKEAKDVILKDNVPINDAVRDADAMNIQID